MKPTESFHERSEQWERNNNNIDEIIHAKNRHGSFSIHEATCKTDGAIIWTELVSTVQSSSFSFPDKPQHY